MSNYKKKEEEEEEEVRRIQELLSGYSFYT